MLFKTIRIIIGSLEAKESWHIIGYIMTMIWLNYVDDNTTFDNSDEVDDFAC